MATWKFGNDPDWEGTDRDADTHGPQMGWGFEHYNADDSSTDASQHWQLLFPADDDHFKSSKGEIPRVPLELPVKLRRRLSLSDVPNMTSVPPDQETTYLGSKRVLLG